MAQLKALVDKLLTNVSNGPFPGDEDFIAERCFPELPVVQMSGLLGKYGTNFLRIEHDMMGGRGEARRVESITRSTATYLLEKHGLSGLVTPDDMANVEAPYDAEKDEVLGLTTLIRLSKEKALADTLTSSTVMTQYSALTGSAQFSDYANSDPLSKAKNAAATVYTATGKIVNTLITSWPVINTLQYHPAILESLGYKENRPGILTWDEIAKAFNVKRILVGASVYESAKEGQTSSLAALWGKHMVLAHIPEKAMPYQKSLGYYVKKAGEATRAVYKSPVNNPPGSKEIIVQDYYQFLIADALCGYLYKDVIA